MYRETLWAVVIPEDNGSCWVNILNLKDGLCVQRTYLPDHILLAPLDTENIINSIPQILSATSPYVVRAIVIIDILCQEWTYDFVCDHPLDVIVISKTLASLYSLPTSIVNVAVISTYNDGQYILAKRNTNGLFDLLSSRKYIKMEETEFASLDALIFSKIDSLRQHDIEEGANPQLLSESQSERICAILGEMIDPITNLIKHTVKVIDLHALICIGTAPKLLNDEFCKVFVTRLGSQDNLARVEIKCDIAQVELLLGAANYANELLSKKGVIAKKSSELFTLNISVNRSIEYEIFHPKQFILNLENDTISNVVESKPLLVVIDKNVSMYYGDEIYRYFDQHTNVAGYMEIEASEEKKNLEQVSKICEQALAVGLRRDGIIIGIGGGVTLDIVGLSASLYRRGVNYLRIPTTLVGLVDVAIGIKQGVNFSLHKNLIGAFSPPVGSINDYRFLQTLDRRQLNCGLAEIIKMAVILDAKLFQVIEHYAWELLDNHFNSPKFIVDEILHRSEKLMLEELQKNLFEENLKRLVDFGHSFSPVIETSSQYSIPHGEAVGIDILLSTLIAIQKGICKSNVFERLLNLYKDVGLPFTQSVCDARLLAQGLDAVKLHRGGDLNLVVPIEIGAATFVQTVDINEIQYAVEYLGEL